MIELITKTYQQTVATAEVDEELKRSLKYNERVPAFFNNLKQELSKINATREEVIEATESLTIQFLNLVHEQARQAMMTDAEKSRILDEQHKADIIRKSADTGIIDEEALNVITEES